ncbi:MAG: type II toxin-antitoxin system HicB family antitoxin [Phycisphaerales bacterium]|nr:type II toxin-antitoxin system HicB family antitoxin [Phycisphaerales bacterium]
MQTRSYQATFLKRDRWWVAWSQDVPGALTQGKTLAEAKANLRDAIRLMLRKDRAEELPSFRVVHDRVRV